MQSTRDMASWPKLQFNEACRSSNFEFIGRRPKRWKKLGDKNTAREMAIAAKVPVVPGSDGLLESEAEHWKPPRKSAFRS